MIEGIVSKRADAPYAPGNRSLWLTVKCLNREEFVVVGWTDPEGSRPWLGALLLAYYAADGRLVYAGRAGTGINTIPARVINIRVVIHTRLTNCRYWPNAADNYLEYAQRPRCEDR
jgi:ATP-dependent DNA ligase